MQRHGNAKYGSPAAAPKLYRSRQGKMEKSFLSFAATYPAWEPDPAGQQLLAQLAASPAAAALAAAGHQSLAWSQVPGSPPPPPGLPPRLWQPGGARLQPHALASVLAARGYGAMPRAANGHGSSIFGSAELTGAGEGKLAGTGGAAAGETGAGGGALCLNLAASLAPAGDATSDDRLRASQVLLQSLYEQRSQLQHPLQQSPQRQPPARPAAVPGLEPQPPGGLAVTQQQQQQQQQQHRGFAPQQLQPQQQPVSAFQQRMAAQQAAAASPRISQPPSPAPSSMAQQRLLQQQAAAAAGSPGRQAWLGR